jgi:hypothetical protein
MERVSITGRRYYKNGKNLYPSITTILSLLENNYLEEIRKSLGEKKWLDITTRAVNRGTVMHELCEAYLIYRDLYTREEIILLVKTSDNIISNYTLEEINIGIDLFLKIVFSGFFNLIEKNIHNEEYMYSPLWGGFAGTTDSVNEDLNGQKFILDYKSSSRIKNENEIEQYKIQIAGYVLMYYHMFNETLDYVIILIANESNSEVQEFKYTIKELKPYFKKLKELVEMFHNTISKEDNIQNYLNK